MPRPYSPPFDSDYIKKFNKPKVFIIDHDDYDSRNGDLFLSFWKDCDDDYISVDELRVAGIYNRYSYLSLECKPHVQLKINNEATKKLCAKKKR